LTSSYSGHDPDRLRSRAQLGVLMGTPRLGTPTCWGPQDWRPQYRGPQYIHTTIMPSRTKRSIGINGINRDQ
jgi:hypothetical protein